MVEIGKRDLRGKGRLALDLFEQNRRYIGVDLATMMAKRPGIMSRLLKEAVSLYERGIITPIDPLTVFDASKIEDAMRLMQKGSHMGKIVVKMPSTFEGMAIPAVRPKFSLDPDASYILVGGLGGLGRAVAVWMAEAGATQIIFLSRSASHPGRYASLVGELEDLGCEATLVGGSVLDIAAVEATIAQATKPIRGVLQASMVLRDTNLSTMSFGDWNAAVGPKVQGTWNLHHALERHGSTLDFLLLFSSTSGVLGQPGQANYSAANTFLDSFVQYRHAQGLPASVIDLGPISEILGVDVTVLEILDAPTVLALGKHAASTLKIKLMGADGTKEDAEDVRGRYEKDWAVKAP